MENNILRQFYIAGRYGAETQTFSSKLDVCLFVSLVCSIFQILLIYYLDLIDQVI